MLTSDFDYHLPSHMIAQTPMEPRDHSRLLTLDRANGGVEHRNFYELPDLLREGDMLVFNNSRVFPARLKGRGEPSRREIELLLLTRLGEGKWRTLVRPGRRMRAGAEFTVVDRDGVSEIYGRVLEVEEAGTRLVSFEDEFDLRNVGVIPLPPYIHESLDDPERYQTVYSDREGSAAAPTAGLHFTQRLLDRLDDMGVEKAFVTLHVGWDSFRPVKAESADEHEMHSEYWELSATSADAINRAKREGRRVISVGTTAVRLLENAATLGDGADKFLTEGSGWVDLFITPGFEFRVIDGLITNFHLPRSTLLMLVSAFAGRENVLAAYRHAVEARYRFYSFGDAMLIA
ncbi:MAG: tRNA preQ1(34) S-adenosylmethionine ribosyltransferase-isomerase QueA [Dehalococcoidia bacterium]|nr:tRNA preQ1(34) S-adenosylmethionine ribosyltransferase-isomerase QueA [Dehalococcoidia bacterium]